MNLQQLQYIVAVDEHRHFQRAAEACFITPATLSMMIKKLEEELNIVIFDRSKQPVRTTEIGTTIIEKAKTILHHVSTLQDLAKFDSEEIAGTIRLAIIPTLAPYLTHLFLPSFLKSYPNLNIKLFELNTNEIADGLKHNRIDIGIAATPINKPELLEVPLFYEELFAYVADEKIAKNKNYIAPKDINLNKLWLLSEEHCLRSQVINVCSLKKQRDDESQLHFEAGSIETLLNIVGSNEGITIIPELVIPTLPAERKTRVLPFKSPVPVREISLITYKYYSKHSIIKALSDSIVKSVGTIISDRSSARKKVIDIEL
jgi:LysR family hydrogen peroxide-inducible transcriptional activator